MKKSSETMSNQDEVIRKLLVNRSEIIAQVYEHVTERSKSELSDLEKKRAEHEYDQHNFLLTPKDPRTIQRSKIQLNKVRT